MEKEKIKTIVKNISFFFFIFILYNAREIVSWSDLNIKHLFNYDILGMALAVFSIIILNCMVREQSKKLRWLLATSVLIVSLFHVTVPSVPIGGYVCLFYCLMFLSYVTTYITKLNLSLSLGITMSILLCILYIIALIGLLPWTILILGIFILGCGLYLFLQYKNKRNDFWNDINEFLNIEFLIFSVFFIISICSGFERYVHSWDEYNMWALNAKKIIFNNSLKGFSYPPMMALWYYFGNLFTSFSEPNLYMIHTIFLYTFIMGVFSGIKDKKIYPFIILAILAFPHLFGGVFGYSTVYADYPSAVVFGFGLIYIYYNLSKKILSKRVERILLWLIVIIITLIKPQGFVLATTLLLIDATIHSIEDYQWTKKNIKSNCFKILKRNFLPLCLPLVMYVVWIECSTLLFSIETFSSPDIMPPTISETLLSSRNIGELLQFILHLFKFFDQRIFTTSIDISVFHYLLGSLILCYLYYLKQTKKVGQAFIQILPFVFAIIVFYSLTALSIIVKMNTYDALNLVSFDRYVNNFNVGLFMFMIWFIFVDLYHKKNIDMKYVITGTMIIFVAVPLTSSFSFFADLGSRYAIRDDVTRHTSIFKTVIKNTEENDKIYVIDQEDKDGYLPMCYSLYYLFPRYLNANGMINWKIQTDSNRKEIKDWALTANDLEKMLKENEFDYLFLYSSTNEFFDEIEYMLDQKDEKVEDYKLFKIVNHGKNIRLQPVA